LFWYQLIFSWHLRCVAILSSPIFLLSLSDQFI